MYTEREHIQPSLILAAAREIVNWETGEWWQPRRKHN